MTDANDSIIYIKLLASEPIIRCRGELIEINRTDALHLLIYAADKGEPTYERESFAIAVLGEESKSKKFRDALSILNRIFKDVGIDKKLLFGQKKLEFDRDFVQVDTHQFAQQGKHMLAIALQDMTPNHVKKMKNTLDLYSGHFLEDYSFDTTNPNLWKEQRQTELATIRHSLLEKVIQYHIIHGEFTEAQQFAEQWTESLEPGFLPLQYLIWLGIKQRSYASVQHQLLTLQEKEDDPTFFGVSVETWRTLLQNQDDPPLSLLMLTDVLTHPIPNQPLNQPMESPDTRLNDFLSILNAAQAPPVIGLIGLPGAGKTLFARQAISLLHQTEPTIRSAWIELTRRSDFESLLNTTLSQFQLNNLTQLPYAVKQTRFKQLIQAYHCVVIIDEGTSQKFSDLDYLDTLANLFDGVQLVLIGRQIAGSNYYPFELTGFNVAFVRQFLIDHIPEYHDIKDDICESVIQITDGLPLALNWLVGFIVDRRFQIQTFIKALSKLQSNTWSFENAYKNYDYILNWLWYQLLLDEKNILFTISMFDPAHGVTLEDILAIADTAFVLKPEKLQEKVDQLVNLNLLEVRHSSDTITRYTLHPICYEYVQQQSQQSSQISAIHQAYIQYYFDYAMNHCEDFDVLDTHRNNILWMFEILLLQESGGYLNQEIVAALNCLFPYLMRCGLYTKVVELFSYALTKEEIEDAERVKVVLHLGQAVFKQGELDKAERRFLESIELARQAEVTDSYSIILRDLGRVYLQRGDYEKAQDFLQQGKNQLKPQQQIVHGQIIANLGVIAERESRYDEAQKYFEDVLHLVGSQNPHIKSTYDYQSLFEFAQTMLGLIAIDRKEYTKAERYLRDSLVIAQELNNLERMAFAYLNLGVVSFYQADYEAALDYFTQGGVVAEYIQHTDLLISVMWNKGAINVINHQFVRAKQHLHNALNLANKLGWKSMIPYILIWFGLLHFCQMHMEPAKQYFTRVFAVPTVNSWFVALALYGLGLVTRYENNLAIQGDMESTKEQICSALQQTAIQWANLPPVTHEDLKRAQDYFQLALVDTPGLENLYIVEALQVWLDSTNDNRTD